VVVEVEFAECILICATYAAKQLAVRIIMVDAIRYLGATRHAFQ